ncbi:MAG TPA: 50S ribosomal protein L25/general stress protein Ctc [Yinghuangia sp.]|uniref:50S ribosomal protein L25/general stress protein Ctc n=1 Tax=Yinghuangia sp. YIM S10712 TaxID=3436930 RepID=UPI002C8C0DA8|nr:50S ribosomal protein L25/general stress protein Ctc [Yinghuangia sp.]
MSEVRIAAESRSEFGKGAARRARREGKVPAVLYGHGTAPVHLSLPGHDLMLALKTPNVLLALEVDGKKELALPKDVQRHPIKRHLEHVDLILVKRGEKVVVEVPVQATGTVAPGGLLETVVVALPVEAEATHLPEAIEVSVEGLEAGQSVHAKDIALPRGTTLAVDGDTVVLHVMVPAAAEAAETGEESAEAAETVEA